MVGACSFVRFYPALFAVAEGRVDFTCMRACKIFNLAGSDECSPKGSTRLVADGARFAHEPFMKFPET